jgi:hypothetical protein
MTLLEQTSMRSLRFLALFVPLAGCAPTLSYSATNPTPHKLYQHAPAQVEVHTVQPPDRPFVDVGVFELDDPSVDRGGQRESVVARLRTEAGKIGCDSIVIEGPNFVSAGLASLNRYRATCIVYR